MSKRVKHLEERLLRLDKCLGKWECECCGLSYFEQAGQKPAASRVVREARYFHTLPPHFFSVTKYVCTTCHAKWILREAE